MIREYDGNIDTKHTTSRYKYCTWLQIVDYTMKINLIYHLEKRSGILYINGCGMLLCLNGDGAKNKYLIKDFIIISP